MNKYNDFLNKLGLPSEEEFNKLIEQLPSYEELSDDFSYDPEYGDKLEVTIFNGGILGDKYCYVDDMNLDERRVTIEDFGSLEELNEVNNILKSAGWILDNYEDELKYWEKEEARERLDDEKRNLLDELGRKATVEQLKEFNKKC